MENIIVSLFGDTYQQDYIDVIISFIEIAITMLSLVTIFFNINYENNVLKLRDIIWKFKNITNFEELNKELYDYYTIEKTRFKIYDQMIVGFRIISIIIIGAILAISVIKICVVNTIGELIFLLIMATIVIFTIIFIINIFKTSKENKEIFTYKELINMDRFEQVFESELELIPKIKIFVSATNGDIEIEYHYPIYCYNINTGIVLFDKNCYTFKSVLYNDTIFRKGLVEKQIFSDKKINKYLYAELKDKCNINIKAKVSTKNTDKSIEYNAEINTTSEGIIVETKNYKLATVNSMVLDKNMEKDGAKFFD